MGSIRAWLEIPHQEKWIQWGSYQEWYESYSVAQSEIDLTEFFDYYLRDIDNDWPNKTPRVRWDALQFGDRKPIQDIELEDFPVPTTEYRELFFSQKEELSTSPPSESRVSSYNSEDKNSWVQFSHTFTEPSRLIGLPKAIVYVSCEAQDDFVVFVILRKKDKNGKDMLHLNFPFEASPIKSISEIDSASTHSVNTHAGQMGILRASHRQIDAFKSMHPQFPFHPHEAEEKVAPGTVVKLEIGIWAMGVDFDAGESISVRVSSTIFALPSCTLSLPSATARD